MVHEYPLQVCNFIIQICAYPIALHHCILVSKIMKRRSAALHSQNHFSSFYLRRISFLISDHACCHLWRSLRDHDETLKQLMPYARFQFQTPLCIGFSEEDYLDQPEIAKTANNNPFSRVRESQSNLKVTLPSSFQNVWRLDPKSQKARFPSQKHRLHQNLQRKICKAPISKQASPEFEEVSS